MSKNLFWGIACALLLSACSTQQPNTAAELIKAQEQTAQIERMEMQRAQEAARNEPKLLLTLIEENMNQSRYFAALAYINSYKQNFGTPPQLLILHAHVLRNLNQDQDAATLYQAALKTDRKAEALHGLGLLSAKQHELGQAISYLKQATTLNPTNAIALSDLGFAYLSQGNPKSAHLPLGQAIELAPKNPRIMANVALLLLMEHKEREALALMQAANMDSAAQTHLYQLSQQLLKGTPISAQQLITHPQTPPITPEYSSPSTTRHIPLTASQS